MGVIVRFPKTPRRINPRTDTARMLQNALTFLEEDVRNHNLLLIAELLGAAKLSAADALQNDRKQPIILAPE